MLVVTRKDEKESTENMIRRFNKKVAQSGVLVTAKKRMYHEKPLSKREAHQIALRKRARKEQKALEALGLR